MLFSSISFVFLFLPLFLLTYYLVPKKYRNIPLFLGSLVFYALGELAYLPLLIATLLINYFISKVLYSWEGRRRRYLLLYVLLYNFGILLGFKYLSDSIPLGISFYTFQITAYVVDVYREKIKPARSVLEIGTYLCLFPQLIAGPIILYPDIMGQIRHRTYRMENMEDGLKTFVLGLSSKILIADVLGKLWNEIQVTGYESISTPMAWLGAAAYSFEIFFDFNGYSLMAIGLGKMLGFKIPKNFDKPYLSRTVGEFWRRWHITLGSWFRDYVYIPLGGSRGGTAKTVRNLFVVWLFTGMWHGKGWNFILWGMSIFVLIVLEKLGLEKFLQRHIIISKIYMLFYIPLSWVIFAVNDIREVGIYFSRLFPFFSSGQELFINPNDAQDALMRYGIFFAAAFLLCCKFPSRIYAGCKDKAAGILALLALFGCSVAGMLLNASNPFLYFRF